MSNSLVLVMGGAASGKSAFAENFIVHSGLPRHYIATSRIWDAEMEAKKNVHIAARGPNWITHEEPLDIGPAMEQIPPGEAVLIDCATMWLTNHVMEESDLAAAEAQLMSALSYDGLCVIVSNELGQGVVPADPLARRFRNLHGALNQRLAALSDCVVFVTAGLPQVLKGTLP